MDRRVRPLIWLWSSIALAGGVGCSSYQSPVLSVGEAVVTERSEEAVRLDIAVELVNPNREPLELRHLEYTLTVDGTPVFVGRRAAQATLAAAGRRRLTVPAIVRYDRLPVPEVREIAWAIRGHLLYLTPGELAELLLDTGVRRPRVGFSGDGRVEMP